MRTCPFAELEIAFQLYNRNIVLKFLGYILFVDHIGWKRIEKEAFCFPIIVRIFNKWDQIVLGSGRHIGVL